MPETEHRNSLFTRKALALLPLALMGAGVWYFVQGRLPGSHEAAPAAGNAAIFGTASQSEAPAARPPAAAAPASVLPEAYDPKAGLDIQGPPAFRSQVTSALKLIWMADRETFLFIRRNIYVVRQDNLTGFYLEDGKPVAALSADHAFRSLTWCAGVLAHQAWHAAYERSAGRKKGRGVPLPGEKADFAVEANPMSIDYKGMDAILYVEDRAMTFQLNVLKKIGAPARETGPLFRRAPRDFHLAHDGNYTIKP